MYQNIQEDSSMKYNTKKTWQKRLRSIMLFGAIVVCFLVLLAYLLEDTIGKKIVSEVQTQLKTEVKVEDVNLSLIRSFPYAALDLRNINIQGTDKQPLLRLGVLRFKINIWSLLDNPLRIKVITLQDGAAMLKHSVNGKTNYDILKPTKNTTAEAVAFILEKAILDNVVIGYNDAREGTDMGFTVKNAAFSGDFSEEKFNLKSNARLLCHGVTTSSATYLLEKKISYKADIQIDRVKNAYSINTFDLGLEDNDFAIVGKILSLKNATNLDLRFDATKCNIGSLLQIFPHPSLQGFSGDGDLSLSGVIKGIAANDSKPAIKADLKLRNGRITSPKLGDAIEQVNCSASLRRDAKQSYFSMPEFKGYFGNQPFSMRLDVNNLEAPLIDFNLDGKIPIASTFKLLNNPDIKEAQGILDLNTIHIKGKLEDMKNISRIANVEMSGNLIAEDIALELKNENIALPQGKMSFNNNTIFIEKVKCVGAGAVMLFNGNMYNLLPVLLSDSLHNDATLDFRTTLYASEVDAKRFAAIFQTPNSVKTTNNNKKNNINPTKKSLISLLNGVFEAQIDKFSYDKITGQDFDGLISFEQDVMTMQGDVKTMQGNMALHGRLSMHGPPNLSATIACDDFDMPTFFAQCKNFGQGVLKAENVAGRMDAKLAIDAYWDNNWNFLDKKLYVLSYLNVRNGYMKDLKMLEDFSTYVKIEDLRDIKFTNMENWFEVRNRSLRIPVMVIRNNALNMMVSGRHSFDNEINYNMKLNAANVVVSRFKKHNPRLDPQQDVDNNGFLDLYFNMAGSLDDYKIQMSRKIVKADFDESAKLKREIQAKLDAAHSGKSFEIPESEYLDMANTPTSKNDKKNNKKKNDEVEYIEGF